MLRIKKRPKSSPRSKRGAKGLAPRVELVMPDEEEVNAIFEDTIMKEYGMVVSPSFKERRSVYAREERPPKTEQGHTGALTAPFLLRTIDYRLRAVSSRRQPAIWFISKPRNLSSGGAAGLGRQGEEQRRQLLSLAPAIKWHMITSKQAMHTELQPQQLIEHVHKIFAGECPEYSFG
jgi:hypothetical protein